MKYLQKFPSKGDYVTSIEGGFKTHATPNVSLIGGGGAVKYDITAITPTKNASFWSSIEPSDWHHNDGYITIQECGLISSNTYSTTQDVIRYLNDVDNQGTIIVVPNESGSGYVNKDDPTDETVYIDDEKMFAYSINSWTYYSEVHLNNGVWTDDSGNTMTDVTETYGGYTPSDYYNEKYVLSMDDGSGNTLYYVACVRLNEYQQTSNGSISFTNDDNIDWSWFNGTVGQEAVKNNPYKSSVTNLKLKNLTLSGETFQQFANYTNAESIDLSTIKTNGLISLRNAFQKCNKLKRIDVSRINFSNVDDLGGMFADCKVLEYVNAEKIDTSHITKDLPMFYNCNVLPKIDVSTWDTSKASGFTGIFCDCYEITEAKVDNWDTSNAISFKNMFVRAYKLGNVNMSNWRTPKLKDMSLMFYTCPSMTEIDLSTFDTSKVTTMQNMFYADLGKVWALETIKFGGGFKIQEGCNTAGMFSTNQTNRYPNLKTIYAVGVDEYTLNIIKTRLGTALVDRITFITE